MGDRNTQTRVRTPRRPTDIYATIRSHLHAGRRGDACMLGVARISRSNVTLRQWQQVHTNPCKCTRTHDRLLEVCIVGNLFLELLDLARHAGKQIPLALFPAFDSAGRFVRYSVGRKPSKENRSIFSSFPACIPVWRPVLTPYGVAANRESITADTSIPLFAL